MLPNGDELIRRIQRVIDGSSFTGLYYIPDGKHYLDKKQLKNHAENFAYSIADRLNEIGEKAEANLMMHNPIEFISELEYGRKKSELKQMVLGARDYIDDDYIDMFSGSPNYMHCLRGLREAVYMMTTRPAITRYVLGAIIQYYVNDEAYFELWKGGGDVEFLEDKTLVIIPDAFVG